MKKVLVTILVLFLLIPLCACAKDIEPARVNSLEHKTIKELEEIEGVENFSDETIKAMSVIIRTNLSKEIDANEYIASATNVEYNNKIARLANSTKGQILTEKQNNKNFNNNNYNQNNQNNLPLDNSEDFYEPTTTSLNVKTKKKILLTKDNNSDEKWTKEIKKSELLKFLKQNNISLSSLSKLSIIKDENGNVEKLSVGGKTFNYNDLALEFDLNSNNITNIYKTKSSIIVEGKGNKKDNCFDLNSAENMAKSGKDYKEILSSQLNNFEF